MSEIAPKDISVEMEGRQLVEKDLFFHGCWIARFGITNDLIKSIGHNFESKQPRKVKLFLTTSALSLQILPTNSGKPGRTDRLNMEFIHDINLNPFNNRCLMVIFTDPKNNLSVLVCSSEDQLDTIAVSGAFKDYKNSISTNKNRTSLPPNVNWMLRHKELNGSASSGTNVPEVEYNLPVQESQSPTGSEGLDGDEFFTSGGIIVQRDSLQLNREKSDHQINGTATESFSVGVQTEHGELDSEKDSLYSNASLQTLKEDIHNLNSEMKAIKFLLERSTGISAEEQLSREKLRQSNRNSDIEYSEQKPMLTNGDLHTEDFDFDLRSVGINTDNTKARKYMKNKAATLAASSNAYRDRMVAVRLRNTSTGSNSYVEVPNQNPGQVYRSGPPAGHSIGRSRPASTHGYPKYLSNTVPKKIENVYNASTRSGTGRRRNVIVMVPQKQQPRL